MSHGQISYVIPMWNLARQGFNPKRILEIGCGCSSFIIRWLWVRSELLIIDDHFKWIECVDNMGCFKADITCLALNKNDFLNFIADNGQFDLIFIDSGHLYNNSGPWRNDFMAYIREHDKLNEDGCVILHDANREEHQEEINNWEYVQKFTEYNTYILSDDKLKYYE